MTDDDLKIVGEANPKQREKLLSFGYAVTAHFDAAAVGKGIMEMCAATKRAKVKQGDGSWDWGEEEPDHYQRSIGLKLAHDWMKHATEHTVGRPVERRHLIITPTETPVEKATRLSLSPAARDMLMEILGPHLLPPPSEPPAA